MLVAALDKERTAVERLRQLDEAKNEFVSTVSHELRTPVTSIVGYTEMLADGSVVEPDPAQVPLLETIARNGQRLIADLQRPAAAQRPRLRAPPRGSARPSTSPRCSTTSRSRCARCSTAATSPSTCRPRRRAAGRCSATAPSSSGCCSTCSSNAVKFTEDGGAIALPPRSATAPRPAWWSATPASASPRRSRPGCSRGSSAPRPRRTAPSRAPASACPSSPRSSRPTAGGSRSTPPTCRARRSRCGCRCGAPRPLRPG